MMKQALIVLLSSTFAFWIFGKIIQFGFYREVYNHSPGDCFHLTGIEHGSEDIQVLPNGLAFISSGLSFQKKPEIGVEGKIYLFDFNNPKEDPVELKIIGFDKYKILNPHGISIWTDPKTGAVYLYVVNHTPEGEAVDKFGFDAASGTLEHLRRIENEPDFILLNDLVVVDEDQFYFTNYHYKHEVLEILLNIHLCTVGFFNGKNASIVEDGLLTLNGITISKDLKTLYLAHLGEEELRVYKRNADNSLSLLQSVYLGTRPDNLDVDSETGDVWIGAHPSIIKVVKHLKYVKDYTSPSQVLRIRFPVSPSTTPEIFEVYSNDGSELSASTVAVRYKNAVLIGSVCTRALYCQLNYI